MVKGQDQVQTAYLYLKLYVLNFFMTLTTLATLVDFRVNIISIGFGVTSSRSTTGLHLSIVHSMFYELFA